LLGQLIPPPTLSAKSHWGIKPLSFCRAACTKAQAANARHCLHQNLLFGEYGVMLTVAHHCISAVLLRAIKNFSTTQKRRNAPLSVRA